MIDKMRAAIQDVVLSILGHVDTLALYEGTVVSQGSDGTLDVQLDDSRFGPGVVKIPISYGVPGVTVKVPSGTRIAFGFHEGRRDRPIVRHFLSVASQIPIEVKIESTSKVTIEAPEIDLGEAAVLGVARQTDPVVAGPFAGTITIGSTQVKAG